MEKEVLNLILVEIREMKGDMSEVKTKITSLEGRMTNVEKDMSEMKNDMKEVKERLINVEKDMSEVKGRLTNVESDMTEVKGRLKKVEELSEFSQETCQSIKNVVTSHYMEFKKHIKSNNTQHNLYNAKLLQYKKEK